METRAATIDDAEGKSFVLQEIVARTGRERPNDQGFVTAQYIANPTGIQCTVAVSDTGLIIGFQSVIRATADNVYDVPQGWGIIGTHISPRAQRQGLGKALFRASQQAAGRAGLGKIDAYIAADNAPALRYYNAVGFGTYRELPNIIQKVYTLEDWSDS